MSAASVTAPWLLRRAFQALAFSQPLYPINKKLSFYGNPCSFPVQNPLRSLGLCHIAQVIKGDNDVLLRGVGDKSAIEEVKHILEMARRAATRREVLHTDFLTPPVLKESMQVLEKLSDVKVIAQGGYAQAERCRISIGHSESEVLTSDPDVVAALNITGNFSFRPCSHGDFLGAILGKGIAREKLGDIILQVANVSVSCTQIPLHALEYEPPRTQSFKTTEASLRVDALASAGFKISRSKLVNLISSGDLRINWKTVTKSGTILKTGDIVSVSGKGRLKIGEINTTRKGRFAVELIRYL
ncbi:uncharacterized protein LOC111301688 isoform X2 [Durio zibethinus]|uniref:Uncharacterized protein LOC111301688 isoform X2 n=1 Tax=Durio zibethinus TaxID=66656 RepID=A0A6P5ZL37_DURZI|nr:uncharacterized protein LOC111301688 isoform X2 [Durio zibethinus]